VVVVVVVVDDPEPEPDVVDEPAGPEVVCREPEPQPARQSASTATTAAQVGPASAERLIRSRV
jgi:hypothetical protein